MTLKPPTRTFPKLNLRDWPHVYIEKGVPHLNGVSDKALSDFTRVVEEMGILDQERSQKEGSRDE